MARNCRSSELRCLQVDLRSIHIPAKRGLHRLSRLVDTQNSSWTFQPEMPTHCLGIQTFILDFGHAHSECMHDPQGL
jgi:hypothetical protein